MAHSLLKAFRSHRRKECSRVTLLLVVLLLVLNQFILVHSSLVITLCRSGSWAIWSLFWEHWVGGGNLPRVKSQLVHPCAPCLNILFFNAKPPTGMYLGGGKNPENLKMRWQQYLLLCPAILNLVHAEELNNVTRKKPKCVGWWFSRTKNHLCLRIKSNYILLHDYIIS